MAEKEESFDSFQGQEGVVDEQFSKHFLTSVHSKPLPEAVLENIDLESSLEEVSTWKRKYEKKEEQKVIIEFKLKEMEDKLNHYEEKIKTMKGLSGDETIKILEENNRLNQSQKGFLQEKLKKCQEENESLKLVNNQLIKELEEKTSILEQSQVERRQMVSDFQYEKETHKNMIKANQKEKERWQQEKESLLRQIDELEKFKRIQEDKLTQIQSKLSEQLKKQDIAQTNWSKELQKLGEKHQSKIKQITDSYEDNLSKKDEELSALSKLLRRDTQKEQEKQKMEQKQSQILELNLALKKQKEELKEKNDTIQKLKAHEAQLIEWLSQKNNNSEKLTILKKDHEKLKSEKQNLQEVNTSHEKIIKNLEEKISFFQRQISEITQINHNFESGMEELELENKKYKEQRQKWLKQLEKPKEQKYLLDQSMSQIKQQLLKKSKKYEKAKQMIRDGKAQSDSLKKKIEKLQQNKKELQLVNKQLTDSMQNSSVEVMSANQLEEQCLKVLQQYKEKSSPQKIHQFLLRISIFMDQK